MILDSYSTYTTKHRVGVKQYGSAHMSSHGKRYEQAGKSEWVTGRKTISRFNTAWRPDIQQCAWCNNGWWVVPTQVLSSLLADTRHCFCYLGGLLHDRGAHQTSCLKTEAEISHILRREPRAQEERHIWCTCTAISADIRRGDTQINNSWVVFSEKFAYIQHRHAR
jgi:hypothetical protein